MRIKSRLFGEAEIDDDKIIEFTQGMMGFEEYKKYAIIFDSEKENGSSIMWLQSLDDADIAFSWAKVKTSSSSPTKLRRMKGWMSYPPLE